MLPQFNAQVKRVIVDTKQAKELFQEYIQKESKRVTEELEKLRKNIEEKKKELARLSVNVTAKNNERSAEIESLVEQARIKRDLTDKALDEANKRLAMAKSASEKFELYCKEREEEFKKLKDELDKDKSNLLLLEDMANGKLEEAETKLAVAKEREENSKAIIRDAKGTIESSKKEQENAKSVLKEVKKREDSLKESIKKNNEILEKYQKIFDKIEVLKTRLQTSSGNKHIIKEIDKMRLTEV